MTLISDFLSGNGSIQGKSGNYAINSSDVVALNAQGQLFSAQVSDYAAIPNIGDTVIAPTAVSPYTPLTNRFGDVAISPSDGSLYFLSAITSSHQGLQLSKYSTAGVIIGTVPLDTATQDVNVPEIAFMANGNIAISWIINGTLKLAIYDQFLNQIGLNSSVATITGQVYGKAMIPLSASGFCMSWNLSATTVVATFSNNGVQLNNANITGAPTSSVCASLNQLSNGNILIAIASQDASKALGFAILTTSLTSVVAYTVADSATSTNLYIPAISSVIAGYFTIANLHGLLSNGYVYSNAAVLQYTATTTLTVAPGGTVRPVKIVNDGINFFMVICAGTPPFITIIYLNPTNSSYLVSYPQSSGGNFADAFYERGFILVNMSGNIVILALSAAGNATKLSIISSPLITTSQTTRATGDFTVLTYGGSTASFSIQKYQDTAILGVAQNNVAANSPGTVIPVTEGNGGYPTNQMIGTVGKSFDHRTADIAGNGGVLLGNAVVLKGIAS